MQQYLLLGAVAVVGILGLAVAWRVAKSLLSLLFWFIVLGLVLAGAGWLLNQAHLLPAVPGLH